MDLVKTFRADEYADATSSWDWLDFTGKTPLVASLFGDIFFGLDTGCWFLDTMEGTLTQPWATQSEMRDALSTADGQDTFLLAGLAQAAANRGLELSRLQVYDLVPPPVLGGQFDVEHVVVNDFVVVANIAGQIHGQVRHLSPGTPIGELKITEPGG
jgi:hypothetical protein